MNLYRGRARDFNRCLMVKAISFVHFGDSSWLYCFPLSRSLSTDLIISLAATGLNFNLNTGPVEGASDNTRDIGERKRPNGNENVCHSNSAVSSFMDSVSKDREVLQISNIRMLHSRIMSMLSGSTPNQVETKPTEITEVQESELERKLKERNIELTSEIKKMKKKAEAAELNWSERIKIVEQDLQNLKNEKELSNEQLRLIAKENELLVRNMKEQEEDKNYLIKQLVLTKKENARLRLAIHSKNGRNESTLTESIAAVNKVSANSQYSSSLPLPVVGNMNYLTSTASLALMAVHDDLSPLPASLIFSKPTRPSSAEGNLKTFSSPSKEACASIEQKEIEDQEEGLGLYHDDRHVEVINRLKRSLDHEQKRYRVLKNQFAAYLSEKTELEGFLRLAIEEVKQDIQKRMKCFSIKTKLTTNASTPSLRTKPLIRAPIEVHFNSSKSPTLRLQTIMSSSKEILSPIDDHESISPTSLGSRMLEISDFTAQDRESVVRALLSNSAVLQLLADATFQKKQNINSLV